MKSQVLQESTSPESRIFHHNIKKKDRVRLILTFLDTEGSWVSTQEINNHFPIAKRTLRATLASMVSTDLIQKRTSLKDTRVTLYALKSLNIPAFC